MQGNVNRLLKLYTHAAYYATKILFRNWIAIPATIVLFIVVLLLSPLLQALGWGGRLLIGLLVIYSLSLIYNWLHEIVNHRTLVIKDLLRFDYDLFSSILNIAFIFWIVDLILLTPISEISGMTWVPQLAKLAFFLLFNPVPEMIYLERLDGIAALNESSKFCRIMCIEWFLPLIIIIAPLALVYPEPTLFAVSNSDPILPVSFLFNIIPSMLPINSILSDILSVCMAIWFMSFRGLLFDGLTKGGTFRL